MTNDLPPVPPTVVKFVEQHCSLTKRAVQVGTWHQYQVYYLQPNLPDDGKIYYIGLPTYALYDGKTVRRANADENFEIMKNIK